MTKTIKIRKGPSESATKFKVGTKKKGNDGNMWKIVENKKGTKRWQKISDTSKTKKYKPLKLEIDTESVWGKNKKLEQFWGKLASGEELILVYTNGKTEKIIMPKTINAKIKKIEEFENDNNIKAIITSARSSDTYESLYKKVKNMTPDGVIKNYKKYLTNYGKGDKTWYL